MPTHKGAYSKEGGLGAVHRKADYGDGSPHSIATEEFKRACDPWDHDTWKLGKVSSKAHDHGSPSDLEPVAAASPTGKYGKKGGSGQRSGQ